MLRAPPRAFLGQRRVAILMILVWELIALGLAVSSIALNLFGVFLQHPWLDYAFGSLKSGLSFPRSARSYS